MIFGKVGNLTLLSIEPVLISECFKSISFKFEIELIEPLITISFVAGWKSISISFKEAPGKAKTTLYSSLVS